MAYTALDLLDKAIYTTEKNKKICSNVLDRLNNNTSSHILITVLLKNLDKSIDYYKKLKIEFQKCSQEEIDFFIYDKISFLIDQFNNTFMIPKDSNINGILNYCLDFQKDILALYIDIQGRVVQHEEDVKTNTYKVIESMIIEKQNYINTLEDFMQKYY